MLNSTTAVRRQGNDDLIEGSGADGGQLDDEVRLGGGR